MSRVCCTAMLSPDCETALPSATVVPAGRLGRVRAAGRCVDVYCTHSLPSAGTATSPETDPRTPAARACLANTATVVPPHDDSKKGSGFFLVFVCRSFVFSRLSYSLPERSTEKNCLLGICFF